MEDQIEPAIELTPMEIESADGATIPIERDSSTEIGRRAVLGLRRSSPPDRTVSRRHLSLRLAGGDSDDGPRVLFEVIGRNPVVVCGCGGRRRPRVYRSSEKGELRDGDRLSLSVKNLSFWVLRRRAVELKVFDAVARREKRTSERKKNERNTAIEAIRAEEEEEDLEQELAALDASQIDPVKEFGFLVKGHEFDRFPRHRIRSVKDWNWFLDDGDGDDDDDDDEHERIKRNRIGKKKKKKKGDDCEDEEWADVEDVAEVRNASRPKYSTRSNSAKKPKKEEEEEEDDDDDDDDETLGGFIVNDDGDDEEDGGDLEEEEEDFDGEEEEEDE